MDWIEGYIERITYQNPENGYTVAQLQQKGRDSLVTVVGTMPMLQPGETVRCFGSWKRHLAHGLQFDLQEYRTQMPSDTGGILKYLGSGLIKGIGPAYAKRIVDRFGAATLDIIDVSPEKLTEVEGIGRVRLKKIQECWEAQRTIRQVMIFLQQYGVSPAYAQKIFKAYGKQAIEKVTANPFHLAQDIHGIGFKTADTIAQKMGHAPDSPARVSAGIEYALTKLSEEGNVCYPVEELIQKTQDFLSVPSELIRQCLATLAQTERIVLAPLGEELMQELFAWLKPLYLCEGGIVREVQRLQHGTCQLRSVDLPRALDWVQTTLHIQLAQSQLSAIRMALMEKIQIISGGPGTGKSTITKAILAITEKLSPNMLLAAPTGRAAKRMTEVTGRKASTIHSLLEYDFRAGGFKRNRQNPLECDLIIVDEASMIDTSLMYHLLKAIPTHARVVLIGDINQLASVGPGNVLKDMIRSQSMPVTMLHEIFRQAAGSHIITNAHLINEGRMPDIKNDPQSDFFFIEHKEPEAVLEAILDLVSRRLPAKYGLNPLQDIQVLAPMRRGIIGTENLNHLLQEVLNPNSTPLLLRGRRFATGDKVMQLRNDYKKEVFNGDIGYIAKIDTVEQELKVQIDGREISYDFSDLDELVLAYAVSVHKYQGSECACIVMPIHTTHYKLLQRNLLYTGVTRGKKLDVLVGTKQALYIAVKNDEVKRRFTGLCEALQHIRNSA